MRLRDFIPWRDFVIETSWSPTVAMEELTKQVDAPRVPFFGIDHPDLPFHGKAVSATELVFRRKDDFQFSRSTSVPIHVWVEPSGDSGARVHVRIGSRVSGGALLAIVVMVATASLVQAVLALVSGKFRWALVGVGVSMSVVFILLAPWGLETGRSETILRGIFERAPARPPPTPPHESGEPYR